MAANDLVPVERIQQSIYLIRGRRIIIDADLALMFDVPTKVLNQAVKRNIERFPEDFMFQLTKAEKEEVVTNCDRLNQLKYSSSLPYAFTEHGAIMAANVLNSQKAIAASVYIVRAFVQLREMLYAHKELAHKLAELEGRIDKHDEAIVALVTAIKNLMEPPPAKLKGRIGFNTRKS
jgi:hypothetical protein